MLVYGNRVHSRTGDNALVRAVHAGDERAFEAIFKRHHAPLLAYCRHMLGNQCEGEDALQQAFIKAHQALLGGKAPRELRPWLYAIARNCCLSAIAARRPTTSLGDHTPAFQGLSEEVRQREDLRELLSGIARLPEDQRSALLLAEIDDLSHQAIATILQCPVNRVKALIYQARSALIADRDACSASCQDIREQISVARGGELRRGTLRRHLKLCTGCRDFQLAVSAQRQSLAAVLPVLPSAGLAAAILGHGAAHGAAHAAGGAGTAATGSAAASAGAGLVPAGGTGAGALLGGGVVTKLAATGAIVALAAGGTVTVHNQLAHATPQRTAHALANHRPAGTLSHPGHRNAIASIASPSSPSSSLQAESPAGLTIPSATATTSPVPLAELPVAGAAGPLLTTTTAPAPSLVLPAISAPSATKAPLANARAKHRRTARHRRRVRRARRHRRHLRAIHRRARLRKALLHPHVAKPQPPKPPVTPVPARIPRRKARPTPAAGTVGAQAGTPTTPGTSKGPNGQHHHPPLPTGTEKTASGTDASEKPGPGKMVGEGSGKAGGGTESTPRKTKTTGTENSSTPAPFETTSPSANSSEQSTTANGNPATTATGTPSGSPSKANPKKHFLSEVQLPNF
jgi:RNA polymerase sigma factor (sigma-70 family)